MATSVSIHWLKQALEPGHGCFHLILLAQVRWKRWAPKHNRKRMQSFMTKGVATRRAEKLGSNSSRVQIQVSLDPRWVIITITETFIFNKKHTERDIFILCSLQDWISATPEVTVLTAANPFQRTFLPKSPSQPHIVPSLCLRLPRLRHDRGLFILSSLVFPSAYFIKTYSHAA